MGEPNARNDHPHQPSLKSSHTGRRKRNHAGKAPLKLRLFATALGLLLAVFALGGYAAWSVVNFYFPGSGSDSLWILLSSILLFVMACVCGLIAIAGFKLIPRQLAHVLLAVILVLSIPVCICILLCY